MKKASSKGEFLNKEIKPNYEFEKIRWLSKAHNDKSQASKNYKW
jgi:hypothetical protein